jgi:hypothetical protein
MNDLDDRLTAIERRLERVEERPPPGGLTEPDPDTPDERWQAAQVWAHMAEFIGYWQKQIGFVVARYDGTPVPFGRTKRDEARIAAIESGRHEPVALLMERVQIDLARLRRYLRGLSETDWQAVGLHQTRGSLTVGAIVDRFLLDHLDEHLDQLDGLAAGEGRASGG